MTEDVADRPVFEITEEMVRDAVRILMQSELDPPLLPSTADSIARLVLEVAANAPGNRA